MKPEGIRCNTQTDEGKKRGSGSKLSIIRLLGQLFIPHRIHPYISHHFNCSNSESVNNDNIICLYYLSPYHVSSVLLSTLRIHSFTPPNNLTEKCMHVIIIPAL